MQLVLASPVKFRLLYIPVYIFVKCITLVTHPCYPNPCPSKDVCEINRETPENGNVNFVPYQCTPGNGRPFTDVILAAEMVKEC